MSGAASNHLSLFPDSDDVLLRYQADDERRQQELAAARERAARRERGELREANLRGEVAELRAEIAALPKMLNERSGAAGYHRRGGRRHRPQNLRSHRRPGPSDPTRAV